MTLSWLARLRAAFTPARRAETNRLRALESALDQMAERVARAELQAERHVALARRCEARALAAEDALIRLQDHLDQMRMPATA